MTIFSDELGMVGQLKHKEKTKDLSTWLFLAISHDLVVPLYEQNPVILTMDL